MTTPEPLVIDYRLDGSERGYAFVTSTRAYREDVTRAVWRHAMPRGQGWSAYIGLSTLKGFPLPGDQAAFSQVTVTDREDEGGRRGIRRAVVEVMHAGDYSARLQQHFDALAESIQNDARATVEFWRKTRRLQRMPRRQQQSDQLVLTHPYSGPADWQYMAALTLLLVLDPIAHLRRWTRPIPLVTLALNPAGERGMVALPTAHLPTDPKQRLPQLEAR